MFFRHFFFARLMGLLLIFGLLFAVGSGLYRSGYSQGFVRGAVIGASTDGGTVAPDAALVAGLAQPHGPSLWFLLPLGLLLFFVAGARGRRRHYHMAGPWGHRGPWSQEGCGRPGGHERGKSRGSGQQDWPGVGPEKQPEDFV